MLTFSGKLISVNDQYNNLTFESERFDYGLGQMVPCSERVSIDKQRHLHLINQYKALVGKVITVPVAVRSGNNGLWKVTDGDGTALSVSKDV